MKTKLEYTRGSDLGEDVGERRVDRGLVRQREPHGAQAVHHLRGARAVQSRLVREVAGLDRWAWRGRAAPEQPPPTPAPTPRTEHRRDGATCRAHAATVECHGAFKLAFGVLRNEILYIYRERYKYITVGRDCLHGCPLRN
jgi:hypothetical protein